MYDRNKIYANIYKIYKYKNFNEMISLWVTMG